MDYVFEVKDMEKYSAQCAKLKEIYLDIRKTFSEGLVWKSTEHLAVLKNNLLTQGDCGIEMYRIDGSNMILQYQAMKFSGLYDKGKRIDVQDAQGLEKVIVSIPNSAASFEQNVKELYKSYNL
jgi:hypothetical protein